jgi:2-iminobutanoate/2-iminopropanoate deaminase
MKKIISTSDAPKAIGPYSQAIMVDNTLYTSGQIAINPIDNTLNTSDIRSETKQVMKNLDAILSAADMTFANVVKCSIFMRDIDHYTEINDIYSKFFFENPPAREAVEVSSLPKNVNLEISLIAEK